MNTKSYFYSPILTMEKIFLLKIRSVIDTGNQYILHAMSRQLIIL